MQKFCATIIIEADAKTIKEGLELAKKTLKGLGLKIQDVKPMQSQRTINQNNALHLLFKQLAEELNEKGFDMRALIREEVELSWTTYSVKEYLWRPFQKFLTGKKSTTKLDKTEEINLIYDNINRVLIERTKGEVSLPPFPSIETQIGDD